MVVTLSRLVLSRGRMGEGVGGPGAGPRHIPGGMNWLVW